MGLISSIFRKADLSGAVSSAGVDPRVNGIDLYHSASINSCALRHVRSPAVTVTTPSASDAAVSGAGVTGDKLGRFPNLLWAA